MDKESSAMYLNQLRLRQHRASPAVVAGQVSNGVRIVARAAEREDHAGTYKETDNPLDYSAGDLIRRRKQQQESQKKAQHDGRNRKPRVWVLLATIALILSGIVVKMVMVEVNEHRATKARMKELVEIVQRKPLRIWLVWTTPQSTFRKRNLKVIDTYLYQHPNAEINIFATELTYEPFKEHLKAGYKINIIPLTDELLEEWTDTCPGKKWINNITEWKQGKYYYSHVTDFIRFCILYREGGVYSDFDALLLQRIDDFDTFIGKDSSGADGKCDWCLAGGDLYLAPGVMGARKRHHLPYHALKIGFDSDYDPEVFNAVGPKAVTKSFKHNSRGIHVFERSALYPYTWDEAYGSFKAMPNVKSVLERLRRKSISLHFYGHATRELEVEHGSLVDAIFHEFSVVKEEPVGRFSLKTPDYLGIRHPAEIIPDLRVMYPSRGLPRDLEGIKFKVSIECGDGRIAFVDDASDSNEKLRTSLTFTVEGTSVQEVNTQLSKLIYVPTHAHHSRDSITVKFEVIHPYYRQRPQTNTIAVYMVDRLVTIMVKTVGRMEKVFNLLDSARRLYPTISIIVADDAENITQSEGIYRGFYYLPLPYDVGLSAGRNRMIERIDTEYFLTLDDDFLLDERSQIEYLLHALEKTNYDVAAGKNPVDEGKFGFDYCGKMTVRDRVLYLHEGEYDSSYGCQHVDFVPNIFVGRTKTFQERIKWDEDLKLGEHEDFFLRGIEVGLKVLTCPAVAFWHDQVPHWLRRTKYDRMRSRVYDFWKLSLRKHGLEKLVSFGSVVMDLDVPPPIFTLHSSTVLSTSVSLHWSSSPQATSFKVYQRTKGSPTFILINNGDETDSVDGRNVVVYNLRPGLEYTFRVMAGNRFVYEQVGRDIRVTTLDKVHENAKNLLLNGDFEEGHRHWSHLPGTIFHTTYNDSTSHGGQFAGRTQILTQSYQCSTPTASYFYQIVPFKDHERQHPKQKKILDYFKGHHHHLTLTGYSKIERLFADATVAWQMRMSLFFADGSRTILSESFDVTNYHWQGRTISVCLAPWMVEKGLLREVHVAGYFLGFRGSVLWDDFVLNLNGDHEID